MRVRRSNSGGLISNFFASILALLAFSSVVYFFWIQPGKTEKKEQHTEKLEKHKQKKEEVALALTESITWADQELARLESMKGLVSDTYTSQKLDSLKTIVFPLPDRGPSTGNGALLMTDLYFGFFEGRCNLATSTFVDRRSWFMDETRSELEKLIISLRTFRAGVVVKKEL